MTSDVDAKPASGGVRSAIRKTTMPLGLVFRDPALRRLQIALAVSWTGDWAYNMAVIVWAFGVGGPSAVGVWAAIRWLLVSIVKPFVAIAADRYPQRAVIVVSNLGCATLVSASAACVALHTVPAVFVMATLSPLVASVLRPALSAWLPSLVDDPQMLTAANATASTSESLAFFVGPALGSSLLALTNVPVVFVVNATSFVLAAALIFGIRGHTNRALVEQPDVGSDAEAGNTASGDAEPSSRLHEVFAGFQTIGHDRGLLTVTVFVCVQTFINGAYSVFAVLMAVHTLHTGPNGVGIVETAFGTGAIIGGFFALGRARHNVLATDLALGTLLWSAPLIAVFLAPTPLTIIVVALVMGFGTPLVDVNFATIIQRIAPAAVMGRVFGAVEGAFTATMALGAMMMPVLVHAFGYRGSFVVLVLPLIAIVVLLVPAVRNINRRLAPPAGLDLLVSIPIFVPLAPGRLETLARSLQPVFVSAGLEVVREGTESELFYIIRSGRVEVSKAGRFLRREGPGEFFGEIGLLRSVPRTATVTAVEDTELYSLDRTSFLDAIAGSPGSAAAVEDVVSFRLRF